MMMAAMPAMMYMTMMFGSLGVLMGSNSPSLRGELSLEWPTSKGLQEKSYKPTEINPPLPGHIGLDDVAHLSDVAFTISGKKDIVQVFVHVSLAHRHPENQICICCRARYQQTLDL